MTSHCIGATGTYNWGPGVVPRGQYCVLGDNRNSLSGSRTWGWLPEKNIIGRVWRSYWSTPANCLFKSRHEACITFYS